MCAMNVPVACLCVSEVHTSCFKAGRSAASVACVDPAILAADCTAR